MKKTHALLGILLILWGFAACQADAPPPEMYYFYEEICASCNPQAAFYQMADTRLQGLEGLSGSLIRCVNTFTDGKDQFSAVCDAYDIPREDRLFPMLVTPAGYVFGEEAVENRLRQLVCDSYGITDEKTIRYYQRPDCPDCTSIRPLIEAAFEAHPDYHLVTIDTNDEREKAAFKALLTTLQVPEDLWQVPFLYNGIDFLSGSESIEEQLDSFFSP